MANRVSLRVIVAGLLSATSTAAYAQSDAAVPQDATTQEGRALDEIVVTGSRTGAANVQDVPIAITAFGSEQIENKGIVGPTDLVLHVPNLSVVPEGQGSFSFGIRGINIAVDNFAFDNAVGTYLNDVYIARAQDTDALLFDVEGIEVLRGPQGTTFGRNTPTGAIVVRTKRPGDDFGGFAQAGIGGGQTGRFFFKGEGALDVPVGENFAVRFAGFYVNDRGYGKSRVTGERFKSRDDYILRATLNGNVGNLEVTLIGEHAKSKQGIPAFIALGNNSGPGNFFQYDLLQPGAATPASDAINALIASGDRYVNNSFIDGIKTRGRTDDATLLLDWTISDAASLKSITGFRDIRRFTASDAGIPFPGNGTRSTINQRQISQEFLFNGKPSERFSFLAGLFLFRETGSDFNLIPDQAVAPCQLRAACNGGGGGLIPLKGVDYVPATLQLGARDVKYESIGVFTNVSWEFLPTLTATGGIRLTKENKEATLDGRFLSTVFPVPIAQGRQTFKDDVVLYDGRLTWKPNDDLLVYAKYGTGYRAGGIGFRAANAKFEPETTKAAEVGFKLDADLGTVPVRVNAAAFRTTYRGFQIPVVLRNPTRQTVVNAGGALIKGLEAEFTARPTDQLDLGFSVGLLDAKYTSFVFNNASLSPNPIDFTDNKLRRAPKLTLTGNLGYRIPTSAGELLFQVDANHQSSQEAEPLFQRGAPLTDTAGRPLGVRKSIYHIGPTTVVNALIKLSDVGGSGVDVSAYVHNLTNEISLAYGLETGQLGQGFYTEPRSFGLTVRKEF